MKNRKIRTKMIFLIVLTGIVFFSIKRLTSNMSVETMQTLCSADMLIACYTDWTGIGYGIFLILLADMTGVAGDFRYAKLLQYGSRGKLWITQVKEIISQSVVYGTYFSLVCILFSRVGTDALINWGSPESFFYRCNKVLIDVEIEKVIIMFLLATVLYWLLIGMTFLILYWTIEKKWVMWILLPIVQFVVFKVMHTRISVSFTYVGWLEGKVMDSAVYAIVIIVVLGIMGKRVAVRREFYDE